jgi:hypothetical protein
MIVRISRGRFEPAAYAEIERRLRESATSLIPAIRKLPGVLPYYAGIDRDSSTMINVSTWRSLDDARQMDSLEEMRALSREFQTKGVEFDRPITNYDTLWNI